MLHWRGPDLYLNIRCTQVRSQRADARYQKGFKKLGTQVLGWQVWGRRGRSCSSPRTPLASCCCSYVWGPSHLLRILCGEELGFGRWYNGSTCRAAWLPDQNPCLSHKAIWAGLRCLTQILVTDMDPQQSHPSRVAHRKGEKDPVTRLDSSLQNPLPSLPEALEGEALTVSSFT